MITHQAVSSLLPVFVSTMVELLGKPIHRRTRMEPSRSMPMSACNSRRAAPKTPTHTPSSSRPMVAAMPRRPPRTGSFGRGLKSATIATANPYRGAHAFGRSPSRSGKAAIQSMAAFANNSTGNMNFDPIRDRADTDDDPSNEWCPDDLLKCAEINLKNKRRKVVHSFGICKSLCKAVLLIAFGFGSGYVYSTQLALIHGDSPSMDSPILAAPQPWGYSPADPLIQNLLQHNAHQDVIEDIKQMKFPGRTPKEEPKNMILPHEMAAMEIETHKALQKDVKIIANPKENTAEATPQIIEEHEEPPPLKEEPNHQEAQPFRHSQIRLRGAPEQPPEKTNDKKDESWDHNEEKLVHIVNKSARKIRLFWIPSSSTTAEYVPMSDPYIDDGHEFYLHARPTHRFVVRQEPQDGELLADLEFAVLNKDQQKVLIYDNWKLELVDETSGDPLAVVHENPKEQHAPPQYMQQQQSAEEYWQQQREAKQNGEQVQGGQQGEQGGQHPGEHMEHGGDEMDQYKQQQQEQRPLDLEREEDM